MTGFEKYKKFIAKVLVAAFFLVCYPFTNVGLVYADTETGTSEEATEAATGTASGTTSGNLAAQNTLQDTKVQTYKVTSDPEPAFTEFKGMTDWRDRKVIAAPENTYVLTAATGASSGQNVLYFGIKYVDQNGLSRLQYVFPGIDAGSRSGALLNYYADKNGNVKDIYKTYGATALEELNYKETVKDDTTLTSWSVQDYAFQTEGAIARVLSIDVYLAKGQWTVQGLALYKMNSFKGYEEYGLVSGKHFLDFQGYLVADLVKKNPGTLTLKTGENDTVVRIGGSDSLYFDIQNYADQNHTREYAVNDSLYSFRMDFADMDGSAISAFQNAAGEKIKNGNGIVEDITMEFQYRDRHGWTRKVALPVILSSYLMACHAEGESSIYGFAQKGETIAFQGVLPEFDSLVSTVTLKIGNSARSVIENNGITIGKATAKMNQSLTSTAGGMLRIAGVSMYKGGCMAYVRGGTDSNGVHLAGATLEYKFASAEPFQYFTTTETGQIISAGGSVNLTLRQYKSGSPIIATAARKNDTFLVTLYTSDKINAGTRGDVTVRFTFLDAEGDVGYTQTYSVKTAAEAFLGPWPSTSGGSYISEYGLQQGSSISFMIEAKNLQEFTNAEVSHNGSDFWEMKNLTICYLESYSSRRAYVAPESVTGTKFWITRDMMFAEIFNLAKTVSTITDENGNTVNGDGTAQGEKKQLVDENGNLIFDDGKPVYVDDGQESGGYRITGGQLFLGDQTLNIDFGKGTASDVRETDYSTVRFRMSHEQTQVDWGFFKKRKIYNVAVQVAKDSETDLGNGDAGSVNYFYFQLQFENGKSGYVLANQQLAGDAFRSGQLSVFTIATNRDYGAVTKVNIVAEDLAQDATPFDKLNIDSITVSEQTTGGTNISYVFDKVGWIDIDYRDDAERASMRGLKARTAAELAKTYENPYQERSVKLLCEISTLPWEEDYNQFQGSMWAKINYIKASDNSVGSIEFDVVKCLESYMNKAALTVDAATVTAQQVTRSAGQGTISDPDTMFRPGKTDRFIIPAISDLKSIKNITFTAQTRNNEGAILNIGKVSVSQIVEDGPVQLTAGGEIYRNFKTKKLAINSESKIYSQTLLMGIPTDIGPIPFTNNELVWSSDQWATPVSRIPKSSDDTVNIYVYPTIPGGNASNFHDQMDTPVDLNEGGSDVHANLAYNIPYSQQMAAACDLKVGIDGKGHTLFYATGVKAPDFISAAKLSIQCTDSKANFSHAIVQHVKGNVVISTSTYDFMDTTAVLKLSANANMNSLYLDKTEESIFLSFGEGTNDLKLQSINNDIAVAFRYISSIDGSSKEYKSPYVYLTDQNINSIREGLMAEIKFDIPYVRAITGYEIAAYGNTAGNISGSCAVVYHVDKEENNQMGEKVTIEKSRRVYSSFMESYSLSDRVVAHSASSYSMFGENSVTPVSITFSSSEAAKTMMAAKDAAVRMNLTYNDITGQSRLLRYEDIRRYIQGDTRAFGTGDPVTIKFFLSEMNSDMGIQSITLLPYDPDVQIQLPGTGETVNGANSAVDDLVTQLREGTGIFADGTATTELTQSLYQARTTTWTITKAEYEAGFRSNVLSREVSQTFEGLSNGGTLRLNTVSFTTYVAKNNLANTLVSNHLHQMVANAGDLITGTVTLRSSTAGFTARAYRMVGEAGEEVTDETIVISDVTRNFTFTVPRNLSGSLQIYRIDVSPVDAPDLVDTIYVSVENEEIALTTNLSLNGAAQMPVTDHVKIMVAQGKDVLKAIVSVTNSEAGISVGAYRMVGDAGENVTNATVTNLTPNGFDFTVPENHSGSVVQYKIEISPLENYEAKDTIYISVVSTPEPVPEPTSEEAVPEPDTSSGAPSDDTQGSEPTPPASDGQPGENVPETNTDTP